MSDMAIYRQLTNRQGSLRWTIPRISPTTSPSVATPNTTKIFPETRDSSHPCTTPATSPVAVNLRMFFATASRRLVKVSTSEKAMLRQLTLQVDNRVETEQDHETLYASPEDLEISQYTQ